MPAPHAAPVRRAPTRAVAAATSPARSRVAATVAVAAVGVAALVWLTASRQPQKPAWISVAQAALAGGPSIDPRVSALVARVGAQLAEQNALAPGSFLATTDSEPHLYVLPSSIIVTAGLLSKLGSEAQLAAALAVGLVHQQRGVTASADLEKKLLATTPKPARAAAVQVATQPMRAEDAAAVDSAALALMASADYQPRSLLEMWQVVAGTQIERSNPATDRTARLEQAVGRGDLQGQTIGVSSYQRGVLDVVGRNLPAPTIARAQPAPVAKENPARGKGQRVKGARAAQTTPTQTAPAQTTPAQTTPAQTTSAQTTSAQTTPTHASSGRVAAKNTSTTRRPAVKPKGKMP